MKKKKKKGKIRKKTPKLESSEQLNIINITSVYLW